MDELAIFTRALDIVGPSERAAFLRDACGDDSALQTRVEALLKSHEAAGSFLQGSPLEGFPAIVDQPASEHPGSQIGPYKLLQQIGEGGMGTVYLAEQTEPVKRLVALKLIKAGMDSRQVIARFEAERRALALMDHPNIAKVLDAGTVGEVRNAECGMRNEEEAAAATPRSAFRTPHSAAGRPYFVMELVRGELITHYCDEHHLTPRQRLELFIPICQALQHAHQKGIIHRDLKPSNVLVALHDGKPVPKVIDFGVAKAAGQPLTEQTLVTGFGAIVGTLEYMAPEQAQINQLDIDTRSDIYSLGVLLYELLTGSPPFTRKELEKAGMLEMLRVIREQEPSKPSTKLSTAEGLPTLAANRGTEPTRLTKLVRGELDWIVMKALEKDRDRRYETANAFAADVERYLNDEPVGACPPSLRYRLRKFVRRNRGTVTAGLALATLLLLGTVGTSIGLAWALRAERTASEAKDKLNQTLDDERVDAYYRRIALAYRELSADNLGLALQLLDECPADLRKWEWHFLARLCRVEQVVLQNGAGVTGLSFSADGERIASSGMDGTLKVWNSRTGEVLLRIEKAHGVAGPKPGSATSVTFHPDGEHLASTGEDKRVKVWSLATERPVFSGPCDMLPTVGTAYTVAFNPLLPNQLAVGNEGAATIWDWKNEKPVHAYAAQESQRISVAFSRDGRRLASGSWEGSVKLWDTEGGRELLQSFQELRQPISALSFSPDARRLAAASFGRRVDVWNTTVGEHLYQLPHRGRLALGIAFSPDPEGRLVVSTGEGKIVHVWEAASGREILGLRGHAAPCGCVAFSPDGLRLASASQDGTIRIWDASPLLGHERQEIFSLSEPSGEVWSLAVSPNGQQIVSAGHRNPAKVWDIQTRQVVANLPGERDVVFCVTWHPDGRIASANGNLDRFNVKIWNPRSDQAEQGEFSLPDGAEYPAAAFSPDGRYLVTGRQDGKVQVWDARDGRPIGTLGSHLGPVRGIVFSPDQDGRYLASASVDRKVHLWDATRLGEVERSGLQPLHTFPTHAPGVGLNAAFSPDGKRIAIGDTDSRVVIWEVETRRELRTLRGHSGDVYTVAFSPDPNGRWIASAGEDSTVKVWDSDTGKLIRSFRGHRGLVNSLAFIQQGQRLVTGSRDGTLKFWDLTQFSESRVSPSK